MKFKKTDNGVLIELERDDMRWNQYDEDGNPYELTDEQCDELLLNIIDGWFFDMSGGFEDCVRECIEDKELNGWNQPLGNTAYIMDEWNANH